MKSIDERIDEAATGVAIDVVRSIAPRVHATPVEARRLYRRRQHFENQIVFSITIPIFRWKIEIQMMPKAFEQFEYSLD